MKNTVKIVAFFLLYFQIGNAGLAQSYDPSIQPRIDSLKSELKRTGLHDTTRIQILSTIGEETWLFRQGYWDTIVDLAQNALSSNPPKTVSKALYTSMAAAYNNIGLINSNKGNISVALEYLHKSLKIQEKIGDKPGAATLYNNIGLIHRDQGDIPLALKYYHKSLSIHRKIGNKHGMATAYNNIGFIHFNQGELGPALDYYHKTLYLDKQLQDKHGMAISYMNIGSVHSRRGKISLALDYYQKGFKIREEIGDKKGMAVSYSLLGGLYLKSGKIKEAGNMGELGLKIARELGFPGEIERNAALLAEVAQKKGNWKEAFEMRNLEMEMHARINNETAQKAGVKQQLQYEYEKKRAVKQKEHEKQIAISVEREEKQKMVSIASGGALLLVIAFLLFIFNRLKVTRKQKRIIENNHQKLAEYHKEIRDSIQYAKRIQEAILPSLTAMLGALKNSFVLYKPKDVIAGDFYWLEHYENKIYFAAADCTGHGVPGAMVSVVCSQALSKSLLEENITETGKLLDRTRELVVERLAKGGEEVKDGMDISLCSIDFSNKQLQWSGANNPLWIIRDGELHEYKPNKQAIGVQDNAKPFTSHDIVLEKNDALYILTDGYQDQFGGPNEKKYKSSRLKEKLLALQSLDMNEQLVALDKEFELWKGEHEQIDDVCVIGVHIAE